MTMKKLVISGVIGVGLMTMVVDDGRGLAGDVDDVEVRPVEEARTPRTEVVLLPTGLCGLVFDCADGAPRATVDPGKLVLLPTGLCGLVFDCSRGYPGAGD